MADNIAALRRDLTRLATAVKQLDTARKAQAETIAKLVDVVSRGASQIERKAVDLGSLAIGTQDVALDWPASFPDTQYMVIPTLITGAAAILNVGVTLKSKTNEGCTVTVRATSVVGSAFVDVLGIRA